MTECIDKLLYYAKTRDISIFNLECDISIRSFNIVVIKLFEWIRLEYKREQWIIEGRPTSLKPLRLIDNYLWSQNLLELIKYEDLFKESFDIENGAVILKECLSEAEKSEIRKSVFLSYQPKGISKL